jgi:hypothetical protein
MDVMTRTFLFLGLRVVYMYEATYDPQCQVAVT